MSTKKQMTGEANTMPVSQAEPNQKSEKTALETAHFLCPAAEVTGVPCVYCGPSVRGVARQFTPYTVGIPDMLKDFIRQHPAAKGLVVPIERFAQIRKQLETRGTAAYILYQEVKKELADS